MTRPIDILWQDLIDAIKRISALEAPSADRCEEVVSSEALSPLVAEVNVRMGSRSGVVVLDLAPEADLPGLAKALDALGPPVDLNIVSPPVLDPDQPEIGPDWEVKKSHGYRIGERTVWFGLETRAGVERLVSVAIHYDTRQEDHLLPPENADGPFLVHVSIGWCGGHGEAVLDEDRRIRYHDELPIYLDNKAWDRIDALVDRGSAQVIRIEGTGRLKKRKGRNFTIPLFPKQRYVVLVVTTLTSAEPVP